MINESLYEGPVKFTLIEGLSTKRIYLSLVKSMITTGILYQPHSFYLGGLLYSSVLCIVVGYLTLMCMIWLSKANDQLGGTYSEIAENMAGSKHNLIVPAEVILLWISNSNSSLARSSSSGDDFIRCSSASESANSVPTRFRIVGTGSPGSSGISGGSSPVSSPRKRTSHEIELKPF